MSSHKPFNLPEHMETIKFLIGVGDTRKLSRFKQITCTHYA